MMLRGAAQRSTRSGLDARPRAIGKSPQNQ
jgi:hypothetical protein